MFRIFEIQYLASFGIHEKRDLVELRMIHSSSRIPFVDTYLRVNAWVIFHFGEVREEIATPFVVTGGHLKIRTRIHSTKKQYIELCKPW